MKNREVRAAKRVLTRMEQSILGTGSQCARTLAATEFGELRSEYRLD